MLSSTGIRSSIDEYANVDPFGVRAQESFDLVSEIDHLWQDIEETLQMADLGDWLRRAALSHDWTQTQTTTENDDPA